MTDAEVAAYLAGQNIALMASVITVDHGTITATDLPDSALEPPAECRGMSSADFRSWLLRGVGDAFKANRAVPEV